jgi:N utilization substance protein A
MRLSAVKIRRSEMKIEGLDNMLEQIHRDRGIPKQALVDAIQAAILSACRKRFHEEANLEAKIDETGEARVFLKKTVAPKVANDAIEISLKEAKKIDPSAKAGDEVSLDVTPQDFGRLAAQTAKQVIIQRIREAEKDSAFDEYTTKNGEIINGIVQRKEKTGYLVNLGRIETLLPMSDSIPGEFYKPRDHIKLYVVETRKTPKGPLVVVSRTHPGLVKKLFELEIPEIGQGILEIKGISREAGRRTKIAILSKDKNVSAVGTCVGHMGTRIQNIVKELGNERVDIIEWNDDPKIFIANSLSPAKVSLVRINEAEHMATVQIPEKQLSLAIGKEGQNVRLAAKLSGWKIDIQSDEEAASEAEKKTKSKKAKVEGVEEIAEKAATIKVHELAKELGISSKEVIAKLAELGIEAKAATSNVPVEVKEVLAGGAVQARPEEGVVEKAAAQEPEGSEGKKDDSQT